ncbi:hypothetical protein PPAR_b0260 [Pseudoalteromonas paragorgicola KMM 3548]|nr:hypothetical protein [Pseudoalteromonas distincta KMM 3548]
MPFYNTEVLIAGNLAKALQALSKRDVKINIRPKTPWISSVNSVR